MTVSNFAFLKLLNDYADCGANFFAEFPNFQDFPGTIKDFIQSNEQSSETELNRLIRKTELEGADIAERNALINRYKQKAPLNFRGGKFFAPPAAPHVTPPAEEPNVTITDHRQNFTKAMMKARELAENSATIEELNANMRSFTDHPLLKTARNPVFFTGNPQAKILLIGEGPGADEDRIGEPFVGVSGKLLDLALSGVGLSRRAPEPENSVLITNVLFYRPPGNRKPTADETALCEPFLRKLITLLAPEKILTLGGSAARVILPEETEGVTRLRGRIFSCMNEGRSYPCHPTLHPAYLLRTASEKKHFWHDLLNMRYGAGE